MATKRDKHHARKEALQAMGRPLARRARSSCELCGASGTSLHTTEIAPLPEEPEMDQTLMLCERCHKAASGGSLEPLSQWRFLDQAVWAEFPATQVTAVRLMRKVSTLPHQSWAKETLDTLYLSPEVEAWVDQT